jgi:hypothetical protein
MVLLAFALAMTVALGVKVPLDFSVFSASAGAIFNGCLGSLQQQGDRRNPRISRRGVQTPAKTIFGYVALQLMTIYLSGISEAGKSIAEHNGRPEAPSTAESTVLPSGTSETVSQNSDR